MFRELALRMLNVHRLLVLALSLSAAAGWGSFAVSSQSSAEVHGQLRRELAILQEAQTKVLSERSKTRVALSEMAQVRADLAAARSEIARLSQPVGPTRPELPPSKPEGKEGPRTSDAESKTGSIGTKTSKSLPVKAALGEKRLPQDRNGQAATINLANPGGQKAPERFQRGATPATTPELDTASLRQLAEAQAQ